VQEVAAGQLLYRRSAVKEVLVAHGAVALHGALPAGKQAGTVGRTRQSGKWMKG
jgi:hypothetical protein